MMLQYALTIRLVAAAELGLCILLYAGVYKPRTPILPRQLAGFAQYALFALLTVFLFLRSSSVGMHILIQAVLFLGLALWLHIGWQLSSAALATCLCAGTATQSLMGRLVELIYRLLGVDSYSNISAFGSIQLSAAASWLVYTALHLLLIFAIFAIFRGKSANARSQRFSQIDILYSASVTVITILLQAYSRPLEANNPDMATVVRVLVIVWSLLVLIFRSMLLAHGEISEELTVTQHLLSAERKQFESIKDDMELINIRCHDIRHQLDQYAGRLTEAELKELRRAITIYDSHLKTGSDILNMVLYKKQAIMEQRQITLSCMADARCLRFMDATDLFSMMNNAIDNAIEAVSKLEDTEKRLISLSVREENGVCVIHLSNFFLPDSISGEGLPETSKDDPSRHGDGMRSIRYVVEKYSGLMSFQTEDGIFHLNLCIPVPEESTAS